MGKRLTKKQAKLEQEHEERLRQFRESARRVGEKIEALGMTEEELDAQVTAARAEFHRSKKSDGQRNK